MSVNVTVRLMDVWKLDSSRVLVVRAPGMVNECCLVSMGTGEQTLPMARKDLFDHLVRAKNRLYALYEYETNLAREFEARFPEFGPFAPLFIHSEDVEDDVEARRVPFSEVPR